MGRECQFTTVRTRKNRTQKGTIHHISSENNASNVVVTVTSPENANTVPSAQPDQSNKPPKVRKNNQSMIPLKRKKKSILVLEHWSNLRKVPLMRKKLEVEGL